MKEKVSGMDLEEAERLRVDAERIRHVHELSRRTAETVRVDAEKHRITAEHDRNAAAEEVRDTVDALTTLLGRMEALEKLRRTSLTARDR